MKTVLVSLMAAATLPLFAQKDASIRIYPEQGNQQISKHIYGQFAEHLGTCIYGGLWVGPESEIPNTQGYRNDVLNALKELKFRSIKPDVMSAPKARVLKPQRKLKCSPCWAATL